MFNKLTLTNKIIFKKYKILKSIGKGSFSSVYKGKNIITNEPVAIKVEDFSICGNILKNEAFILFYLKNYGIPEFKSFGVYKRYKILVQGLLGDNLEKIFLNNNNLNDETIRKKNIKDVCMIAIQLIDRLEFIHSKYIIHRDLKPENIMLDLKTKSIVYLIDFGMAKKYRSGKTKKHIKFAIPYRLTGTARYCSVNALKGTEQSRRDDLESAGYVLIYLALNKQLPWMGLNIIDKLER
jgi:serine/threonine protein kinase